MSTTIGIVGGGQLARMLALAGVPLGLRFVFLDPAVDPCAAAVANHLRGDFDDEAQLARLAARADMVTYEFESVPEASIAFLAKRVGVFPSASALAVARDRLREKTLFRQLGIPTPPFEAVSSFDDLERAVEGIGLPAVLKTRTLGYDGKGQALLRRREDLAPAWERLGGVPLILEGFIEFQREVSVIAVRGRNGETAFYPLTENVHREGILRLSRSRPGDPCQGQAQEYAERLLHRLDYVGVLALECFQAGDLLLANEMAPRVHNSGHWTIEGAQTSQFENHLRAIMGVPLGGTAASAHAAMVNLIGEPPESGAILALPGTHLHLYDKVTRPGRKLGHITLRAATAGALEVNLNRVLRLGGGEPWKAA